MLVLKDWCVVCVSCIHVILLVLHDCVPYLYSLANTNIFLHSCSLETPERFPQSLPPSCRHLFPTKMCRFPAGCGGVWHKGHLPNRHPPEVLPNHLKSLLLWGSLLHDLWILPLKVHGGTFTPWVTFGVRPHWAALAAGLPHLHWGQIGKDRAGQSWQVIAENLNFYGWNCCN